MKKCCEHIDMWGDDQDLSQTWDFHLSGKSVFRHLFLACLALIQQF